MRSITSRHISSQQVDISDIRCTNCSDLMSKLICLRAEIETLHGLNESSRHLPRFGVTSGSKFWPPFASTCGDALHRMHRTSPLNSVYLSEPSVVDSLSSTPLAAVGVAPLTTPFSEMPSSVYTATHTQPHDRKPSGGHTQA